MKPKINKINIQGFRAFGKSIQTLSFDGPISAIWGSNSQGKTSLAEAFEFLFTGRIVRRNLTAGALEEFANALRNAHMSQEEEVVVEAEITGTDGKPHVLTRTLVSDYPKRGECVSKLEIDGSEATESELFELGIVFSQHPYIAPILAQHTLGYLFSAGPGDRADYFRNLLEVTDLAKLRDTVADLAKGIKPADNPIWKKFIAAATIPEAQQHIEILKTTIQSKNDVAAILDNAVKAVLETAEVDIPLTVSERVLALKTLLADRRKKKFPVGRFNLKKLDGWASPDQADWENLNTYIQERVKVDKETRQLAKLFVEVLKTPAVKDISDPIDCFVCGTEEALTPERIAYIRDRLRQTKTFKITEEDAIGTLNRLNGISESLVRIVSAACPDFLDVKSEDFCESNFRPERIRMLLSDSEEPVISAWLNKLRTLAHAKISVCKRANALSSAIAEHIKDPDTFGNVKGMSDDFDEVARLFIVFSEAFEAYSVNEKALAELLKDVIDESSDTKNWQGLIDLSDDPDSLNNALIEYHAYAKLQDEIRTALQQIEAGNKKVLNDKFSNLSEDVRYWWYLLRPDEPTFFSSVKSRESATRAIDFKAGLALSSDHNDPKSRDVIAVFSQSQLHCLGLALFIARSVRENSGFMILDDPILASDEDYRVYFSSSVLKELINRGMQVIVLTQDRKFWLDIENLYRNKSIDMFWIELTEPEKGTMVTSGSDNFKTLLSRAKILLGSGNMENRKKAGNPLRVAAERFCKEMLVKHQRDQGDNHATISKYAGRTLEWLSPKVEGLLDKEPDHQGKFRIIRSALNPTSHDDDIASHAALKQVLGLLKYLWEQYIES